MSDNVELNDVTFAYDRYASIYDRVFGWVLQNGRDTLAAALNERAQGGQSATLVEMGVGTGLMLHLYPKHYSITGVDVSAGMLAVARKRIDAMQLTNVTLELVNAEHSHLQAESADHVVLPYVYSVSPDPDALVREAWRLCKMGGTIWILNHFSGTGGGWGFLESLVRPFAKSIGFRSDFSYERYIEQRGWIVERVQPCNLFGLSRLVEIRKDRPAI